MIEALAKVAEVATEAAESSSVAEIDPDARRVETEILEGETDSIAEVDPDARIAPVAGADTGKSGEASPFYRPTMPINDFPVFTDKDEMPSGDGVGDRIGNDMSSYIAHEDVLESVEADISTTKDTRLLKQEDMQLQGNSDDSLENEARAP